jgi:hypothetical protein
VARIRAGTGAGAEAPEAAPGRPERRRVALVALAVAAVVVLVVTALPGPRAALARLLGIGGVQVTSGAELDPDLDRAFELGDPIEVDEGIDRFPGDVDALVDELGRPTQAGTGRPEGAVSLVWPASDRLPALGDTGAGVVLTASPPAETPEILKRSTTEGSIDPVDVGDHEGMWVSGPHEMAFTTPDGEPVGARLAGHTLVWTDGHTTYRLESELTRSQAAELAARLM